MRVRRTQEERSATTRAQLVDAAAASIAELGLQQSTLATIADRAGVTSGAVQHHFRSRNELLLAVVDAFGKSLGDSTADAPAEEPSVAACVKGMLDRYWLLFGSRQYLAVMKIWLGTEVDAPLYRQITRRMRWFETRFDREWVDRLAASGKCAEDIRRVRHVALGAMRGLALSLSFVDRQRARTEVALLEAMVVSALQSPVDPAHAAKRRPIRVR